MMKKMAAGGRPKERSVDLHVVCLVNTVGGKDAEVLFGLNYSFYQHTSIGCDTSS